MFKSISYDRIAYLGFSKVKVWAQDNELHYSKDVMLDPYKCADDAISDMSPDEFSKKLDLLKITDWRRHYKPDGDIILDGVSWTVTYEDTDFKKKEYTGDNEYPANWKKFIKLLKEAVGEF